MTQVSDVAHGPLVELHVPPPPFELGKIATFSLKLGKIILGYLNEKILVLRFFPNNFLIFCYLLKKDIHVYKAQLWLCKFYCYSVFSSVLVHWDVFPPRVNALDYEHAGYSNTRNRSWQNEHGAFQKRVNQADWIKTIFSLINKTK